MKHYIEFTAMFDDGDLRTGEGFACSTRLEAIVGFGAIKENFSVDEDSAHVMVDMILDEALEDTAFITAQTYTKLTGKKLLTSDEYAEMEINQ